MRNREGGKHEVAIPIIRVEKPLTELVPLGQNETGEDSREVRVEDGAERTL